MSNQKINLGGISFGGKRPPAEKRPSPVTIAGPLAATIEVATQIAAAPAVEFQKTLTAVYKERAEKAEARARELQAQLDAMHKTVGELSTQVRAIIADAQSA